MYLSSFIHRDALFLIAERWFCGRPEPGDALRLTEILISDGYVVGETLRSVAASLLGIVYPGRLVERRIHLKGELRDVLAAGSETTNPRTAELFRLYGLNPDFFYREAPINGILYQNEAGRTVGLCRLKRPKRIAEKANRYIASWIFNIVQERAREMARERARHSGISLEGLITPEREMVGEFVRAEESVARDFSLGKVRFERASLAVNDIGGIKIIASPEQLSHLETVLGGAPGVTVVEREEHRGRYRAVNIILQVEWEPEDVCRKFRDGQNPRFYTNRGISEERLRKGLETFFFDPRPTLNIELILSTFEDLVESELGAGIHEERILAQRDDRHYRGYIPTNVEFLLEYLFAVGFSPCTHIENIPIKLWGRYLPDTLGSCIRKLHQLPEYDLFY